MSWRDRYQPASFKGVPFEAMEDSQPAGPRTQVHEYPQRDKPMVEPLGRRTNEIKIQAFVAGDDCLEKRDALLDAIWEPGSGELIHPWLGSLIVSVTDCSYRHSRLEKGVVRFEITFVEGESEPDYPVADQDSASLLNDAAADMKLSAIDRFTRALESLDMSQLPLDAILQPINQVVDVLQDVYGTVTGVTDTAEGLINQVIAGPEAFAHALFGAVGDVRAVFDGFYGRAKSAGSLLGLSGRLAAVAGLSHTQLPVGNRNRAFVSAVRGLAQDVIAVDAVRGVSVLPIDGGVKTQTDAMPLSVLAKNTLQVGMNNTDQVVSAGLGDLGVDPPVADDVLALRTQMADSFWALADGSPPDHYERIATARVVSAKHLMRVATQGVRLTHFDNAAVTPALVLAYRRYGDATTAADIIARNEIKHPGFVPALTLQVPRA